MNQDELNNLRQLILNSDTLELGLELSKNIDDFTFNKMLLDVKSVKFPDFYYHKLSNTWINYRFKGNHIELTCDNYSVYFRFENGKLNHKQLKAFLINVLDYFKEKSTKWII